MVAPYSQFQNQQPMLPWLQQSQLTSEPAKTAPIGTNNPAVVNDSFATTPQAMAYASIQQPGNPLPLQLAGPAGQPLPELEDPAAGPPPEQQLSYWLAGTILGIPLAAFFNEYLFKPTADGNRYRLYKLVAFIDGLPGIHQLSKGLDNIGKALTESSGKKSFIPYWISNPAKRFIKRNRSAVDQFFHDANQLDVLKYHADDYLKMAGKIGGDKAAKFTTLVNLNQRLASAYDKANATLAGKVYDTPAETAAMKMFYKDASSAMVAAARQIDEPALIKQIITDEVIAKAPSDELSALLKQLREHSPNIDHARLKLNGQTMLGIATDSKGRYAKQIMKVLSDARKQSVAQQTINVLRNAFTPEALKAARLSPELVKKLSSVSSLKEAERIIAPGLLRRVASPLTASQRKALKPLLTDVKNELKLRRRIYGAYGRLQGIKHYHLPFYQGDLEISRDLKKVAGNQFNGKKRVGSIGRMLATFVKAIHDSFAGGMVGAGNANSMGKLGKYLPKFMFKQGTIITALMAGMFFSNPLYQASKAEKGDKLRTFTYHFLGAELGTLVGWQVGSLLFNEIQLVPNLTMGIDKLLSKVGIKKRISPAMLRHMKWPFVTLTGLLSSFVLPTFITGAAFAKRGEMASNMILGKPQSVIDYETQLAMQEKLSALAPTLAASTFNTPGQQQLPEDVDQLHQALKQIKQIKTPAASQPAVAVNQPNIVNSTTGGSNTEVNPPAVPVQLPTANAENTPATVQKPVVVIPEPPSPANLDKTIQELNNSYQGIVPAQGTANDPYNGLLDVAI